LTVFEALAGRAELRAVASRELQLELVDRQLQQHHLRIACLDHTQ
jgi:hypothetical protein